MKITRHHPSRSNLVHRRFSSLQCAEAFFYLMTPLARGALITTIICIVIFIRPSCALVARERGTSALSEQLIFKGAAAAGRKRNYFCCCLALGAELFRAQ
jgi:hypothetical protein